MIGSLLNARGLKLLPTSHAMVARGLMLLLLFFALRLPWMSCDVSALSFALSLFKDLGLPGTQSLPIVANGFLDLSL